MNIFYGLVILAIVQGANSFKSKSFSAEIHQQQPETYYQPQLLHTVQLPAQQYQEQHTVSTLEHVGVKGSPAQERIPIQQPAPIQPAPAHPQALAYLVIRAVQQPTPQYQYLAPMRYEKVLQIGQNHRAPEQLYRQPLYLEQPLIKDQIPEQPPQVVKHVEASIVKGPGKLSKLKSSLDRFAASAKSKLTFGGSYQVISEEIVTQPPVAPSPQPQPQPQLLNDQRFAQQQQLQEDIPLTNQEQEIIRETEQQDRLEGQKKGLSLPKEQVKQQEKAPIRQQLLEEVPQAPLTEPKGHRLSTQQQSAHTSSQILDADGFASKRRGSN